MDQVITMQGALLKQTVTFVSTDTSTALTSLIDTALVAAGATVVAAWGVVKALTLSVETNAIRVAFGCDAVAASLGHPVYPSGGMRLANNSQIRAAKLLSMTAGSAARLQVTLEY